MSSLLCSIKEESCNVKSLVDENAQGKLSEQIVLGRFIAMEELTGLSVLKIEKCNFQELDYDVNFESYFEKQIYNLRSFMPQVEFEGSVMFSSLVVGEGTYSFFLVGDHRGDLKLEKIQQVEFNKDLRINYYFSTKGV